MHYVYAFALIRFLKHDRYSSEVTKPINNPEVIYIRNILLAKAGQAMCCIQEYLNSNVTSVIKGSTLANHIAQLYQLLLEIQVLHCIQA